MSLAENISEDSSARWQASLHSAFFSLPTISKYFKEQHFRPIKIIGVLCLSEPKPDVAKIRARVIDRLLEFPRFSSYVSLSEKGRSGEKHVFFNRIPKSKIDLKYHFQAIDGQGTFTEEEDLSELVSDAHIKDWDPDKPLWYFRLVSNIKGGKSMLIFGRRSHHRRWCIDVCVNDVSV